MAQPGLHLFMSISGNAFKYPAYYLFHDVESFGFAYYFFYDSLSSLLVSHAFHAWMMSLAILFISHDSPSPIGMHARIMRRPAQTLGWCTGRSCQARRVFPERGYILQGRITLPSRLSLYIFDESHSVMIHCGCQTAEVVFTSVLGAHIEICC